MSIFSSVVFFHFRPCLSQIAGESATKKNVKMLVAPRVRMLNVTDGLDTLKMFAVTASVAAENNHDCSVVIARTPNPVGLMIANRFRQTEPRPEVIDRARFAEVVRENGGARLFFGRKRFVDARCLFGHFAPAKLVREILRERSGALVFGFWRLETELLLVDNSPLRRK